MNRRRKARRPVGDTVGGILAGFDQQIMRTTPPPHELVQKGAPVRGLSGADGDELVIRLHSQGDAMPSFATSPDGTRIAYDRIGDGSPVVLVGGLLSDRHRAGPLPAALAAALGPDRSVVTYDRRGRGDSGDTRPYAVEREIEDLVAVIEATGAPADVYGHSSGAGLSLRAAAAGAPIRRLILYEPPWSDDPEDQEGARALSAAVGAAIDEDRPADAIRAFMGSIGLPPEVIEGMTGDPATLALARTMPYDHAVMGDAEGGSIPVDVVQAVRIPTLVITGGASQPFFAATADRLVARLGAGS
jgi:pimeloyl-ACP methyl ester carboxylesterase